eukprot:Blabericola_migrator_1__10698@NODE_610_length_7290_cov_63_426554_g443_i0_p5_GENE_NODE_610_length_7290_cov_63_426554_g443_i0NODE_610_length_7290_cov_63_426554_g443_i0_p5_ORF_typecomplete_len266_score74_66RRM_1/PF00076_22/8_1e02RRM_1/PF00076_22/2_5e18eIF3g/PF12353_8/1_1e07RRM_5/PF13893_6/3_3e07RRM_Rrp7/PF17799_1/1_7e03RRM_Rrp7/PF17799_1/0_00036RRM_7/PF16367_5/5_5e03RRM_7/PF16367_5/0_0014Nup35_RRM_2/PF14605_6/2_5e03Nup35_RRM_2/PF14605_6/7_9e03Nup35_RRM_2/PF14605_6/0_0026PHM7_cyt/PF14703_6/2_9e02PHM
MEVEPQPPTSTVPKVQQAWADMDQDVEDEGEPLITEQDGTVVATMYFREADGRQMKKEKRYRIHRKVLRVSTAVREREETMKKFGYEALDFNEGENKKFATVSTQTDEVLIIPKHVGEIVEPVTGLETQSQKRLLADVKKLFDTLVSDDPSAALALAEKDEAAAPVSSMPMERQQRVESDDRTVRVSNLPEYTTEKELGLLFGRIGQVNRTYLARHKETNISKGFAFITFKNRSDAEKAVYQLHKKGFQNVLLNIEWAKKKTNPS